jgi:hypothetical protein
VTPEELDRPAPHAAEPPAAVGVHPAAGPKPSEPLASAVRPPVLRLGAPAPPSASAAVVPRENLRRIPVTLDPISTAAAGRGASLDPLRVSAGARVFGGLQLIQNHTQVILQTLSNQKLPASLIGALHQPDGTAAARVQLQFTPASIGAKGAAVTTLTADDGSFTLGMPLGADVPTTGISLTVHGANGNAQVTVAPDQIAANGVIGVAVLPQQLSPLPVSILAALQALVPAESSPAASANGAAPTVPKKHAVTIGESNSLCQQTFAKSETTDRFPWGLFFRIVEPQMSIVTQARQVSVTENKNSWLAVYQNDAAADATTPTTLIDRTPIDQPLSVDGFRDQVAGIDSSGYFTEDETVPMAASLGLGYILRMAQQWKFKGLGIGDLIYALPLAPGEQQQIAVFERQDTTGVTESESFSQAQAEQQTARADTSTSATFNQSFDEMVLAGSSFNTSSSSGSAGVSFGIGPIGFGGGGGSSSSSGTSNSSLSGARDTTAQAAQATHSSAENTAAAHLSAQRTGMRLASASENMSTTTKVITNHNHTHALTMQYWEVQRMYDVSTTIEGVTLVCLIPMQVVRFMPPGQPVLLTDPSTVDSSPKVMERYKYVLRHLDTLTRVVPRQFQRGLQLLAQFAADPTTIVDSSTATAETVIKIELEGNFLPCERIFVSAVTKRNSRVGPVQLTPSIAGQPLPIPESLFGTRDELTAWLTGQRQGTKTILQGSLAVPPSVNRSDIIGFEIGRQFNTVSYTLTSPVQQAVQQLLNVGESAIAGIFGDLIKTGGPAPLPTVVLGPGDLEPLLGGPTLARFYAAVENFNSSGTDQPAPQETYANDGLGGVVLPAQPYPVPALQIAPVLRYQDVLEIERSAQHVVRNTARYSKDVWISLSPDETAILLDGHTIGVPPGGLTDASQMIPLLNCLQNTILGTYGNSLIMPLVIPQDLADQAGIEPDKLQQALLDYQREAFVSPQSTIALPTRGVVGEAVLGSCPSAEKIDITRFWNWQDAPADTAPGIGMVQLPTTTPSLTTGVTAPNSLTNLPPLINNLITAPQPNTGLLQAMGQQASSQQDFSPTLTGQQQLAQIMQGSQTLANQARSDALKTSQTLASQSMQTMSNLVSTAMKGSTQTPGGGTPGTGTTSTGTKGAGKGTTTTAGGTQATQATQTGQAAQAGAATGAGQAAASGGSSSDLSSVVGQVLGAAAGAAAAL